jgi:hypothetical protein
MVRSLAGALTAGVLFAGCSDDDNGPSATRNVNVTIPLQASTSELVEGGTFTGVSGTTLSQNTVPANSGLAGNTVSIAFADINGATGKFTMSTASPAMTATGTVAFASCTFTVTTTTNAAVLAVGSVITISNCSVTITASNVPVGDEDGKDGTMVLNVNGTSSSSNSTEVEIRDNGTLVVTNGDNVAVVTTILITGSSGG